MAQGPEKEARPPVPVVVVEDTSCLSLPWRDPEGRSIPTVAVEAVQGEQDPVSQEWRGALRVGARKSAPILVLDTGQGGRGVSFDIREALQVNLYVQAAGAATVRVYQGIAPGIEGMATVQDLSVTGAGNFHFSIPARLLYMALERTTGADVRVWAVLLPWPAS